MLTIPALSSVKPQSTRFITILHSTKVLPDTSCQVIQLLMSDRSKYTVGWICAVETELTAARLFLDEEYENASGQLPLHDGNSYTLGRIAAHDVVIGLLPMWQYGTNNAAIVTSNMIRSFPNLRFCLMVGIGGGAPTMAHDIRLGDIVVSVPDYGTTAVIQYDYGITLQGRGFEQTGTLNLPPNSLLAAIGQLKSDFEIRGQSLSQEISAVCQNLPRRTRSRFEQPDSSTDKLYKSDFIHMSTECCTNTDDLHNLVARPLRDEDNEPVIHYGVIASGNQLMKDAVVRDRLAVERGILCFEMEAAGMMNQLATLVIRGICDYSDSHKNQAWQGFAAMTAACYAKKLLCNIRANEVQSQQRLSDIGDLLQPR